MVWQKKTAIFEIYKVPIHIFTKAKVSSKENGTQPLIPFLGADFHALSHGVIRRIVLAVGSKHHILIG